MCEKKKAHFTAVIRAEIKVYIYEDFMTLSTDSIKTIL